MKFRWKCNADDRRKAVARKIKALLKEEPTLPEKLMKGYRTDFTFSIASGKEYRFFYAGGDTPKGGIYYLLPIEEKCTFS